LSRPFRSYQPREPKHRRNGKIRAREVRVIDEAKQQLGVMSLSDALRLAQSKGLDLIETVPNATPPVCRIAEYGKLLYEESKRQKQTESAGVNKMKELQLTPGIAEHDFTTKVNHAIEFLSAGMKVCVRLRFRGRQRAHKEFGFQAMNKFVAAAAAYGRADSPPKMLGDRDLNVVISPLARELRGKSPRPSKPKSAPENPLTAPPPPQT
jgi:translation initiation factor IF-3